VRSLPISSLFFEFTCFTGALLVLYWYNSTNTDATRVRSLPIIVRVTRDVLKGVEYLHAIRSLKEPKQRLDRALKEP
jgi:hypothetical protein